MGKAARRGDWKVRLMPALCATLPLGWAYSGGEMKAIRAGVRPEAQEDKWFVFFEGDRLFFHRSWTGICVYAVRFEGRTDGGAMATEAEANRDPAQYSETDDGRDREILSYLIDALLLGRPARYPSRFADPGQAALEQWSSVGRAMLRKPRRKAGGRSPPPPSTSPAPE